MLVPRWRPLVVAAVALAGCRDASSSVVPETPLGQVARDWLTAHNRDEGHAMVHFTIENRGTGPITHMLHLVQMSTTALPDLVQYWKRRGA